MEINEHIKSWYVQWLYIESLYSKYAGRYHLTRATMTALDEIYHHEDGCSQKDICQVLNIPKQTVSSVMGNLEKKDLSIKKSVSRINVCICIILRHPAVRFVKKL